MDTITHSQRYIQHKLEIRFHAKKLCHNEILIAKVSRTQFTLVHVYLQVYAFADKSNQAE